MGNLQGRAQNDLVLEDIDGTEYRIVDPSRLTMRAASLPIHERDDESLRRHEYERGSDRYETQAEDSVRGSVREGYVSEKPPTRDQMFIRDGNAEILRLVTRGKDDDDDEAPRLNQPDGPYSKEDRHHYRTDDTHHYPQEDRRYGRGDPHHYTKNGLHYAKDDRHHYAKNEHRVHIKDERQGYRNEDLIDQHDYRRKDSEYTRDSFTEDYAKSQSRPKGSPYTKESKGSPNKDRSVTDEEGPRGNAFEKEHFGHDGNSIEENGLREKHHTHGGFASKENNPYLSNRPYTNEDFKESAGKEVIMRRFIEDQVSSHSNRARIEEERQRMRGENSGLHADEVESSKDDRSTKSILGRKETQATREDDDEAFKRIMNTRETLLTTADVTKLTTIQRDLLLARFLVEEQKRLLNRDTNAADDTQSLPGVVGVAMGTQTDVDTGTQTDRIYFVKRRAKSDNDDSGSEEDDYQTGSRRFRKKKTIVVVDSESVKPRKTRRLCETFKSPIMEESENVEVFNGFIPTKTSTLRTAAIREKYSLKEESRRHHHFAKAHPKETFYIMKSISDQDIHSISKHREDVLSSLEKTQVHKINIPNNVHREDLLYDERSKSSLSIHDLGGNAAGNFQDITQVYRGATESTVSAPPTHRYLNDTISSLSKKSPTRYGEKKAVVGQARYMDWYDKDLKNREKTLTRKPQSSVKPTRRKVSDPVPKKRTIKKSDYEQIKRELLKTEKIPAFTIQPDEPPNSEDGSPPDGNNSKRDSIQLNQKPEDHDSGIAMPFSSLPPAILAVALSNDELEKMDETDFIPSITEKSDDTKKEKN